MAVRCRTTTCFAASICTQGVRSATWLLSSHELMYPWVYGSPSCHMDVLWPGASIPNAISVPSDWHVTGMHTWVVVPAPLRDEVISHYRLVWGWAPIFYE
jgi:hypothetical protein